MDGRVARIAAAVAAPLAVVAGAYALWWISDRLVYIGPLDRAAFGWAVVIPVWMCAPIAAGLAWRTLSARATTAAATTVGAVIGAVFAFLFWRSVASPDCGSGPARAPADWILPSLVLGVVIGAGMAGCGLLAVTIVRRGHPWWAAAAGAGAALVLLFVGILVFAVVASGPGCQRPAI